MARKTIFLSAGDDSGDLHAASMMRALREMDADVDFVGLGMHRMEAAGLEPLEVQGAGGSAMWLHNILRIGMFRRRLETCRHAFRQRRPDLVVLVDYGGFNLFVAKAATAAGIPVLYYVLPQIWAHGLYRLKKIKRWVSRALVIYPFEAELYRRHGLEAEYVGHPIFDHLAQSAPSDAQIEEVRRLVGGRLVAVFPGSRRQEVCSNLPIALRACRTLKEEFGDLSVASVCPEGVRPLVREVARRSGHEVRVLEVPPAVLARAADLCITKSGTITIEIGSQLTPMVIFYMAGPVLYFLAKGAARTPYLGLVNTLAGRVICPEKAMWRADAGWVVEEAGRLLRDSDARQQCGADLAAVMENFARPGASRRAATAAIEMLHASQRLGGRTAGG